MLPMTRPVSLGHHTAHLPVPAELFNGYLHDNPLCLIPAMFVLFSRMPYTETVTDPNDVLDIKEWVMTNIELNDPIELRRNNLRNEAEAAGFADIDVRNLGNIDGWEMRFNRGGNQCATAAEAEVLLNRIVYFCGWRIDPARFVAIVDGEGGAARFWLEPTLPVPAHI